MLFTNILEIINSLDGQLTHKIYTKKNMNKKKLKNAINKYAHGVNENDVYLLIDDTFFGSAKEGVLLTNDSIYIQEMNSSPYSIKYSQIYNLSIKKKMTCTALFINKNEVKTFTQPDSKELLLIFNTLDSYFEKQQSKEISNTNDNSVNESQNLPPVENNTNVTESNINYMNEQKIEERKEESTVLNDDMKSINIHIPEEFSNIKVYNQPEKIIPVLKKLNTVYTTSNVFDFFTDYKSTETTNEQIRNLISAYIVKNTLNLRKKIIDDKNLIYFQNDLGTIEILILVCNILVIEMSQRGFPERNIGMLLRESLSNIFDEQKFELFSVICLESQKSDNNDKSLRFYMRILTSNQMGRTLPFLRKGVSHSPEFPSLMNKYSWAYDMFGDIANSREILYESQHVIDKILDVINNKNSKQRPQQRFDDELWTDRW